MEFPIRVNNRKACLELMKAIEKELPKVKWAEGQKPTEYIPSINDFPLYIRLGFRTEDTLTYGSEY